MSYYPTTTFELIDESSIGSITPNEVPKKPFYFGTFTSDKGPEDWRVVDSDNFFKLYGKNISFAKHGQPLLQAAMSCNWGAKMLVKRIVAEDSTLGNLAIIAKVASKTEQKTDEDGNLLYIDGEGNETVEVTGTPAMSDPVAVISYRIKSVENVRNLYDANIAIENSLGGDEYLLWTIADNGRGISSKRIMILPDYMISKGYDFTFYNLYVMENGTSSETIRFAIDPDRGLSNTNISLGSMVKTKSTQIQCIQNDEGINTFLEKVQEISGYSDEEMATNDILFGCTKKGQYLKKIVVDTSEGNINLQHPYGHVLEHGSNGAFGDSPITAPTYEAEMVKAFDEETNPIIYNVDQYKLDVCIDANYPSDVKRAIEHLVTFREDCVYFRDMGAEGLTSIESIESDDFENLHNMFCHTFHNYYDIIDPYTRKQITVTIGYSLSRVFVQHFNNGVNIPMAGILHGFTFPEIIDGTVNFLPVVLPSYNQKEYLNDLHINYISQIDDQYVLETQYTSQDKYTQWSFINNVMAVQEVVKAVRTRCPAIRYHFIDGEDLELYMKDVNEVLSKYKSNFKYLNMTYMNDETYIANHVFYAMIEVVHRDFVQAEYFKLKCINSVPTAS